MRGLEGQMWDLISLRFVDARREQIRGYGYDEFAVFAELIQNAEDAYASRKPLGLPEPPARDVTFAYSDCDGVKILTASHYGRPFNLWRHGRKQVDEFRYDVEGVLKSAGSFKPHTAADRLRPIGRFGLGFKSVYLVTDKPSIHSGDWHFEITAGCIPNEIRIPVDYAKALTKIVLPLTAGVREERDGGEDASRTSPRSSGRSTSCACSTRTALCSIYGLLRRPFFGQPTSTSSNVSKSSAFNTLAMIVFVS